MVPQLMRPWSNPRAAQLKNAIDWHRISLSVRFLIAASIVTASAMVVLGWWVNERIRDSVLHSSALGGAVYIDSFLEPYVQSLAATGELSATEVQGLDRMFGDTVLGNRIVEVKIWGLDGRLLYSSNHQSAGQSYSVPEVFRAARGETVAEFEEHQSVEPRPFAGGEPLIEIYAPLHDLSRDRIVAVGEFYEPAGWLEDELDRSRAATWSFVAALGLVIVSALYFIVHQGSRMIDTQRVELRRKFAAASRLAHQNITLREVADQARLDASEANEHLLARIGAELHDGPVQMLTLLALRLSAKNHSGSANEQSADEHAKLSEITNEVLTDLRNISAGLVLPEIENGSLDDALRNSVLRHQDLTGASVSYVSDNLPRESSHALKTCLYRVVQEALNNGTRHAPGSELRVAATVENNMVKVTIADNGPGVRRCKTGSGHSSIGLAGMRHRVTALNGSIELQSDAGNGMLVKVMVPL
ncbi:sensor histidine kinase [Aestuariivirga sp.]|uniref:sensor histidine kinase n=1 Tax=Aestuariivirga sp. TaxID=2650926 RepID=UPI0035941318